MSAAAVAAIAVGGIAIAGAAGAFNPGQPSQPNVGAMTADQINAEIGAVPANYAAQAEYNPKFAALNSTIAWQNLFGTPGSTSTGTTQARQTGWYDQNGVYLGPSNMFSAGADRTGGGSAQIWHQFTGGGGGGRNGTGNNLPQPPAGARLYNQGETLPQTTTTAAAPGSLATAEAAQPRLLALQSASRANDIADVQRYGPAAMAAMREYNPGVTSLFDTMGKQATDLVNTNGALDPFTSMALQQGYRGAEAARGMAGGSGDAAMEAYYQAATQEQRRLTNLGVAGSVAGQEAGYYGDPFQQVLARTSGGVQVPGFNYTANQPSATADTAGLLNGGMTAAQMQGYGAYVGTKNAGWNTQMQSLSGLLATNPQGNSGLSSMLAGLQTYF